MPTHPTRTPAAPPANRPTGSSTFVRTTITLVMAITVGLAFVFSFGNVWALALHLGIPHPIAPLIGPMVDLSVAGLMVAIYHLTLNGIAPTELRPAKTLLHVCGLLTLALNTAEPLLAEHYDRAALDTVAPALLLGWGAVGPLLLRHLHAPSLGTDHSQTWCPETERSSGHAAQGDAAPQRASELSPEPDTEREQPTGDEQAADLEKVLPAEREPGVGPKRTGRKPAASMDRLAEIARPAVAQHGPTLAVIRKAVRESGTPISNERLSELVQRFKDEQAARRPRRGRIPPPRDAPARHRRPPGHRLRIGRAALFGAARRLSELPHAVSGSSETPEQLPTPRVRHRRTEPKIVFGTARPAPTVSPLPP